MHTVDPALVVTVCSYEEAKNDTIACTRTWVSCLLSWFPRKRVILAGYLVGKKKINEEMALARKNTDMPNTPVRYITLLWEAKEL